MSGDLLAGIDLQKLLVQVSEAVERASETADRSATEAAAKARGRHLWQTAADRSWQEHSHL